MITEKTNFTPRSFELDKTGINCNIISKVVE